MIIIMDMGANGFPIGDRPSWRVDFERALAVLKELPVGADSWTAHQPSSAMIAIALEIAANITKDLPHPLVAAGTDGTIQIKWQKSDLETSIFIYPDCTLEYLLRNFQGNRAGDLSISQVNDLLAEF
jgi:hypothetical protein